MGGGRGVGEVGGGRGEGRGEPRNKATASIHSPHLLHLPGLSG